MFIEPFQTCWDRILRADLHSRAGAKLWNEFLFDPDWGEPYSPSVHVDDDGQGSIWVSITRPLPTEISLEFGEFLYQMRAALDACVYEAACMETRRRPPPDEEQLQFPIDDSSDRFNGHRRYMGPLSDKPREIIESVQPYMAPADLPDDMWIYNFNRSFGILNDWARIDRHRHLHVAASWASNISPTLIVPDGVTVLELDILSDGFYLDDYAEIARFRVDGWEPSAMTMQANPNLTFDIAINEPPPPIHDNDTIAKRFVGIRIAVSHVVRGIAECYGIKAPREVWVGGEKR